MTIENEENQQNENEAEVLKILNKRVKNDTVEYLVKWKDKPDSEETWEVESNLNCQNLINEYEETTKSKDTSEKGKNITEDSRARGFDRGLDADKIIGATDASGELLFLVMWKGCDEADLMPARQINIRCPELVIDFYESKKPWTNIVGMNSIEEIELSD